MAMSVTSNADAVARAMAMSPKKMKAELRRSAKSTAVAGRKVARAAAMSGTPAQRHMAMAIGAVATSDSAIIRLNPRGRTAGANPVFWGADPGTRTGWNADNEGSRPQFMPHVGHNWSALVRGEGPYAINDGLAAHKSDFEDDFMDGQLAALARAFPSA